MSLWAHSLVKNEERYLWFAVMSVINHVDRVMIWDTGSTDNTPAIAKEIKKRYPQKIDLQIFGEVTPEEYTGMRQKMLETTDSEWFMILDGDEVWWDTSIARVRETIEKEGNRLESIVTPNYSMVGDIYHYQEEAAGKYEIDGRRGHINIRFINRNIPGLYTTKPHGQHGYYDKNNNLIQDREPGKRRYLDTYYMHFTHLVRSSGLKKDQKVPKRSFKYKYELGKYLPLDFYYPEVFFRPKPDIVSTPWVKRDRKYILKAAVQTPLKMFKRRFIPGKTGY